MALKQAPNSLQSPDGSYYVTLTDGAGNLVSAGGGAATSITTTTTVTPNSGTTGVLFNNSGVVGSDTGFTYAGAGGAVALTGKLTLATGTAASNSIQLTGTAGTGFSVAAGTLLLSIGGTAQATLTAGSFALGVVSLTMTTGNLVFNGNASLGSSVAATIRHGSADAAVAVAQTISVQNVVAGTSNVAGANWTFKGSVGTGTGAGGQIIFQTAPASTTGSTQNALASALTLTAPVSTMQPSVVLGNQAIATTASDGFLYIASCAGTPSGTPTTFTGRVPMVFDTTGVKFWIFTGGAWKGVVVA